MTVNDIQQRLKAYEGEGKRMFVTSSFQSHSLPLLHMISTSGVPVDVLFINTGFHFPETLCFRDEISKRFGLKMIDVRSNVPKNLQRDPEGQFYFISDPDYCCFLNKTQPLEPFLQSYDIWINGVRRQQSAQRAAMEIEQDTPHRAKRFHPLLDWTSKDIHDYRKAHDLPSHPLEEKGYLSIGCEPCTRKFDANDDRSGRWFGMKKTECGLHTDLIKR